MYDMSLRTPMIFYWRGGLDPSIVRRIAALSRRPISCRRFWILSGLDVHRMSYCRDSVAEGLSSTVTGDYRHPCANVIVSLHQQSAQRSFDGHGTSPAEGYAVQNATLALSGGTPISMTKLLLYDVTVDPRGHRTISALSVRNWLLAIHAGNRLPTGRKASA